jgi:DNA (cytosine-5)-methyltransferase 1
VLKCKYNKKGAVSIEELRVLSLFSGIGAFEKALSKQNIPYKLINFCEIDKYAIKSYCAIHNVDKNLNLGDISKVDIEKLEDFDLMTWGFCCQDISIAGKQKGFIDANGNKTRSGLYYDGIKILKSKKPKYSIIENVKALTQKKFQKEFKQILNDLDDAGYNTYWKILNAKNYGILQNRERIFIISIRKDIDDKTFKFPKGFDNEVRLKDILENNVDRKYYINEHFLNQIKNTKYKTNKIHKEDTLKLINSEFNNLLIMDYRYDEGLRIRKNNLCPTLTTKGRSLSGVPIIYDNKKLRFITPLECWRLMGFDDEDFYKAKAAGISDTQLYKQAGNSIVVNVLEYIFKNLFLK